MEKELPIGWIETNLDTIVVQKKGRKPLKLEPVEFISSVPYLDIHALEKGIYRQYAEIKSSNLMDENMIAIVWDGARSGWVSKGKFGAIGSTLAALKPINVDINYAFYFLKSKFSLINTNPRGIGIPHVDPTLLWNLNVPLPPFPEQQRIVAKLDSLFGHLYTLKTRLERIPQLMKDFRQKVLIQAVTGKLTEEWREGRKLEYANVLLQKIKDARIKNYSKKLEVSINEGTRKPQKPILEVKSDSESEYIIPLTSVYCCLGEIGDVVNGSTPSRTKPEYWNGNIPWISSGLVQNNIIYEAREYISKEGFDNSSVRMIPKGSILIAMIGEGKTRAQTSILEIEATINQNIAAIIIEHGLVNSKYLQWWLFLNYEQNRVFGNGTGPQALNCQRVRELPFVLYPFEEQQEIVRRVESLFAKADQIEASYQKLKAKIEQLPQALLAKAFRGELVEQLPTDGDAHQLLEEIRKAKAGLEKGGKTRKIKENVR